MDSDVAVDGFAAYAAGPGRAAHDRLQREAEAAGVFGVPSWLVGEELYWGLERLERVYAQLGLASPRARE